MSITPEPPLKTCEGRLKHGSTLNGNIWLRRVSSQWKSTLEPKKLQRVLDFIESRLRENITLEDLAGQACLSAFHFSRLFHEATGMPPHRYVIERRIEAARKMLLSKRSTLAEIALDTGFGSQANFSRTFRKSTGMTPGQYRDLSTTTFRHVRST